MGWGGPEGVLEAALLGVGRLDELVQLAGLSESGNENVYKTVSYW